MKKILLSSILALGLIGSAWAGAIPSLIMHWNFTQTQTFHEHEQLTYTLNMKVGDTLVDPLPTTGLQVIGERIFYFIGKVNVNKPEIFEVIKGHGSMQLPDSCINKVKNALKYLNEGKNIELDIIGQHPLIGHPKADVKCTLEEIS